MSATVLLSGLLLLAVLVSCAPQEAVQDHPRQGTALAVSCAVVAEAPADLSAEAPAKFAACPPLPLRQYWAGSMPQEQGVARIGASEAGLAVYVRFEDSDIFSTATADQQRMWQLGDVAEVFVKPGRDRTDYWEVHVTPNGFLMDLHIPSREGMRSGEHSWEEIIAPESGATFHTLVAHGWWSAELTIPWSAFGLEGRPSPGTTWQFAVCRYNYNGGLEDPELSSTAPLTQASFHRYEDYMDLVF